MNSLQIKRHMNVRTAGHVVMVAFAVASLANVESFFAALHPGLAMLSWGLGIALGSGLLVMAGLLSGMIWDWTDARFMVVATTAGALALLSGGIQAAAYNAHMSSTFAACIVGISLPVVGELGVALAVSAYVQAQRRQRMSDAQAQLADGVRSQISEAIAHIDPTKIRGQVERAASQVTRAVVDSTVEDMIAELSRGRTNIVAEPSEEAGSEQSLPGADVTAILASIPIDNADPDEFSQRMADAKRNKTVTRRNELLHILALEYNGVDATALNKTELGDRLGTTRQTIGRDIQALVTAGKVELNGVVQVI